MNFNTWFSALQTRSAQNCGAGLIAFRALLSRLHNPQNQYKIVHVAGTNGKGTVCTLLARALSLSNKKTGLFISPHLISPTERIQIDGAEISVQDFQHVVEEVIAQEQESLNLFEILTAAALVYFAKNHVEYVVLETGLGGRKDSTNICIPVLSIITSIGLDHTQLLGETLEKIAIEKAGIIKKNTPVLCGYLPPQAERVMKETAREKNAPLEIICTQMPSGNAQEQNQQLVKRAAKLLGVTNEILQRSLAKISVPGRFEIFSCGKHTLILDGAHNPPAMENLLAFWQNKTPYATMGATVVCGFMKDKDYRKMFSMLFAHFKTGIVTAVSSSRALKIPLDSAQQQDDMTRINLPSGWKFVPNVDVALSHAQENADIILVTGSFYLVGEVRKLLIQHK